MMMVFPAQNGRFSIAMLVLPECIAPDRSPFFSGILNPQKLLLLTRIFEAKSYHLVKTGVIILPTQTMHCKREILQNYYRFCIV